MVKFVIYLRGYLNFVFGYICMFAWISCTYCPDYIIALGLSFSSQPHLGPLQEQCVLLIVELCAPLVSALLTINKKQKKSQECYFK